MRIAAVLAPPLPSPPASPPAHDEDAADASVDASAWFFAFQESGSFESNRAVVAQRGRPEMRERARAQSAAAHRALCSPQRGGAAAEALSERTRDGTPEDGMDRIGSIPDGDVWSEL